MSVISKNNTRKNKKTKSMRKRLVGFIILQMVVIALIISVISYLNASSAMQRRAVGFSNKLLSMISYQIDEYLRHMEQYSQDVLYEKSIYNILDQTENFSYNDVYAEKLKRNILHKDGMPVINLFAKTIISRVEIQSVALLDNYGKIWVCDNDKSKDIDIELFLKGDLLENIKASAKDKAGKLSIYLHTKENKVENIFFVRSVYSPDTYKQLGYFVILADTDYFYKILSNAAQGEGFGTALLGENGEVIYKTSDVKVNKSINDFLSKDIDWQINNTDNLLLSRSTVNYSNWDMVATQRLEVLFEDIFNLRNILMIITAIVISVFSLISLAMATDILKPIKRLTTAIERMKKGETEVSVVVDREDELGYLSKTFNEMAEKNEMLVRSIYRAQITNKDAKLQALQSQINPHFLYNTLESISWTARLKGVDEISEMVEDLADIMEAGIGKNETFIPLQMEVEYIDKYLRIMKKRFEDRLETNKKIDESLLKYKIPRLLIQPLIENAIYHGIDRSSKGGFVDIIAMKTEEAIEIIVCNSGKGISEEEIERINSHLSIPSDDYFYNLRDNQKHNVGLENVNRRIKLYYGEKYGIKISRSRDGYTEVTATLPLGGMDEV